MKPVQNNFHLDFPVNPQEEFAGVVARGESLRGGWVLRNPRGRWRGCLRVCWRGRSREDRPRIFHEYSNGWRDIRAFVVLFEDGCLCTDAWVI